MASKKRHVKKQDEPLITDGIKQHLKYIIGLSISAKILLYILTVFILGAGMDMYIINYYYEHAIGIFQGNYPYISYYYEYPILVFVPVIIALIPSLLLNSVAVFMFTFSALTIAFDCITACCIYLIARKVWNDPKKAFTAAFVYIIAICTAYFAMIDYGTFPAALMMMGLTMLFYGREIFSFTGLSEYSAIALGYFAKVFPAMALPFVVLYKSQTTSLKQEIISALKIILPIGAILVLPTFIFNPASTFKTYFPDRLDIGYFPNTIIWTLHVWLHDIFGLNVTIDNVLMGIYVCMVGGLLALLYAAFRYKKQDPSMLLKFILCGIMLVVLSYKVRSPSYILWFTPLMAILIVDSIYKIAMFGAIQILGYIEFPLTFWALWTNDKYTNPIYSANWYLALILFTVEFGLLVVLTWITVDPPKMYKEIFKT